MSAAPLLDATLDAAHSFVHTLWPDGPPGHLALWTLPDLRTYWIEPGPAAADRVAELAVRLAPTHDVYLGMGAQREALGPDERGKAAGVVAVPGVWIDLDTADGHHKQERLPSRDEALAFVHDLPLSPTMVVNSGGGLHVHHVFREPLLVENETDREYAESLVYGWQSFVRKLMANRGWYLDSTHSLAQILRVPGTLNHKGGEQRLVALTWLEV